MADVLQSRFNGVPERYTDLGDGGFAQAVNARAIAAVVDAAIASGASLSGVIDLGAGRLARIVLPSALTGTQLTFQTSYDGTNFANLYDETGTEVTYTVAASREVRVPLTDWLGIRWLKIRAGTSGSPSAQGADRALKLVTVL